MVAATIACGKKGPPLLPFVRIPAAAEVTSARRVGNDVYVTVSVPTTNVDESQPASLAEIKVYAVTANDPPPGGLAQFMEGATLVATIPVAPAADPGDRSGTVVPDPTKGALQGTSVTIRETLSPEALKPRPPAPAPATPRPGGASANDAPAATPGPLRRFYLTVPFSARQRSGTPSAMKDVPLDSVPDRVQGVRAGMSGHAIVVQWEPSGGLLGWLLDRPLAPEVPLTDPAASSPRSAPAPAPPSPSTNQPATPPTTGSTRYNVYRDVAPDPLVLTRRATTAAASTTPATPANAQPIADLKFSEEVPFDERRRCYQVRAVRGTGSQQVESEPSEPVCFVPVDLDPPAAPTGLTVTVVEGEVQLRWEPNGEEDLRGYVVLRREAGDDTLQTLTNPPTPELRYTDSGVTPGRTYTYVVQAVDTRIPLPNVSEPSSDVTVTAR